MRQICLLQNTIQEYAWGSHSAIPKLLGTDSPSETPQAELWMGAHPKAPSLVFENSTWQPLDILLEKHSKDILGARTAKKFAGKLPYLFKILAASKPLSIQAHPSLAQAVSGFAHEEKQGIPIDASYRNYRDENHKPECICALTPYWGLCGFRQIPAILGLLLKIQTSEIEPAIKDLSKHPDSRGLKILFQKLITMPALERGSMLSKVVEQAKQYASEDPIFEWILKLHKEYGCDFGILSPVLLNLVCLQPGQALFLPSGVLHAYLNGLGIELMANSDNVLRGGLTPKHIDVPELLKVLRFEESKIEILEPVSTGNVEKVYQTQAKEFLLSVITPQIEKPYQSQENRSVEIIICVNGKAVVFECQSGKTINMKKGQSIIIPAAVRQYVIEGDGVFYKAAVPQDNRF